MWTMHTQKENENIGREYVYSTVDDLLERMSCREPVREYSPKRAWGMSLFFCASAGILLMLVYRFWCALFSFWGAGEGVEG